MKKPFKSSLKRVQDVFDNLLAQETINKKYYLIVKKMLSNYSVFDKFYFPEVVVDELLNLSYDYMEQVDKHLHFSELLCYLNSEVNSNDSLQFFFADYLGILTFVIRKENDLYILDINKNYIDFVHVAGFDVKYHLPITIDDDRLADDDANHKFNHFQNILFSINALTLLINTNVTTEIVKHSGSFNNGKNEIYKNPFNSNFNLINVDKTFFTNLYVENEFGVKGHFRLQPYGKGKSKVKKIYIREFKKTGYRRVAGKIKAGF